jgi:hypothetical protein
MSSKGGHAGDTLIAIQKIFFHLFKKLLIALVR